MSLIWLSHFLNNNTPTYGNSGGIDIKSDHSKDLGDSCNSHNLSMPNHVGSHVDVPYHFINEGRKIDSYEPEDWVFNKPFFTEYNVEESNLIIGDDLFNLSKLDEEVDLLLIRTNFERFRGKTKYWKNGPGIAPEVGKSIKNIFPNLKAIGVDFISITSYQHRDLGRESHLELLSRDIRLFEDLSLKYIYNHSPILKVIALPLIINGGDGAPVTIIANQ
jgi:arylformamidase